METVALSFQFVVFVSYVTMPSKAEDIMKGFKLYPLVYCFIKIEMSTLFTVLCCFSDPLSTSGN